MMRRLSCAIALVGLFQIAHAGAGAQPDKSGFNLFRPAPDALLRDMATDRPDKTESAFTVDAGHYQIEMDLVSYTYDRSNHKSVKTLTIAPINLKVGVLNNVDLQIIAEIYNVQMTRDRDPGRSTRVSGFGDLLLRCKTNFWGNDGGPTALSVMPYVKLPTSRAGLGNGAIEGGIIFPFAMELPGEWDMGAQVEVDYLQDSGSSDYHQEFASTITVSHDIAGKLGGYVELFSNLSTERDADWIATFDFGFTYALSRDVQLDAGTNIGLTDAADDFNPFIGISLRY
ncbi:MAG TPA: transporter [Chthoniobacterales bacterium]|nr:transporter [Chthoniobacterales bacterium]